MGERSGQTQSGMRLTQQAMDRCEAFGVEASSVLAALQTGETFRFFGRPWVAVLNPETGNGRSQELAEGACGSLRRRIQAATVDPWLRYGRQSASGNGLRVFVISGPRHVFRPGLSV